MITSLEFTLVLRIVKKIFAIAQVCGQPGIGIAVNLVSIPTELAPPVGKELLLRLKARVVNTWVSQQRIDGLNLVLLDERAQQPVPHHDDVIAGTSQPLDRGPDPP